MEADIQIQNQSLDRPWDPSQQHAIERCTDTKQRIVAVTGEAGTGKTTLMKKVYDDLTAAGYSVEACALAGKAAKRIQEATGIRAQTIHRLLEFTFPGERDEKTGKVYGVSIPRRTSQRPLECDVVLADEYAMVNQEINRDLLNAIKPGGIVRIFGDINQLPPIETDEVNKKKPTAFEDMLKRFDGIRLTEIHRTGEGSSIVSNGRRILSGMVPLKTEECGLFYTDQLPKFLMEHVLKNEENGISYQSIDNQIITPRNSKCWIGSVELNMSIQPLFHETMAGAVVIPRHKWEEKQQLRLLPKDKIIFTKNDYNIGIFNGETGIIQDITDAGEIVTDFGDRVVCIPPLVVYTRPDGGESMYDPRREIQLAFVITTHKAQGSEYKNVTYLMGRSAIALLNRSNFYTGETRARTHVDIITDQAAMAISLQRKKAII